ncbi:unnamed protein product [Arabidopsis lyrata]|nr:unnamed protein product [Arabidopsis lyrata]
MGKTASSKVVMNKEELLLFVEKKRKEVFRRDCRDQSINETESDLESSMDKTESSNVIKSKEDSFLGLIDLVSLLAQKNVGRPTRIPPPEIRNRCLGLTSNPIPMDDDMASSKVIMNKEELLLFVENKRKEDIRKDSDLALTELVESFVAANMESLVQLIKKKKDV